MLPLTTNSTSFTESLNSFNPLTRKIPWITLLNTQLYITGAGLGDAKDRIQEKLDKLEDLKRKQEELETEIDEIKRDIGQALVEEDVTIKTSYVSKRLIQGNITHRFVMLFVQRWERDFYYYLRTVQDFFFKYPFYVQN